MKTLDKEFKIIRIISCFIVGIIIIIGLGFNYLIADLNDASEFVLIGRALTLAVASLLLGLIELVIQLKKNNDILSDIYIRIK